MLNQRRFPEGRLRLQKARPANGMYRPDVTSDPGFGWTAGTVLDRHSVRSFVVPRIKSSHPSSQSEVYFLQHLHLLKKKTMMSDHLVRPTSITPPEPSNPSSISLNIIILNVWLIEHPAGICLRSESLNRGDTTRRRRLCPPPAVSEP